MWTCHFSMLAEGPLNPSGVAVSITDLKNEWFIDSFQPNSPVILQLPSEHSHPPKFSHSLRSFYSVWQQTPTVLPLHGAWAGISS